MFLKDLQSPIAFRVVRRRGRLGQGPPPTEGMLVRSVVDPATGEVTNVYYADTGAATLGDRGQITNVPYQVTALPGADFSIPITAANVGGTTWAPPYLLFAQQVQNTPGGDFIPVPDPRRTGNGYPEFLSRTVEPGQSVTVTLHAVAPAAPGTYTFGVDVWTGPGGHEVSPIALVSVMVPPGEQTAPTYVAAPSAPAVTPVDQQAGAVVLAPAAAALPAFLQATPGAAWYQNPLVLLGGGAALLLLVMMRK
jgi:hypothetical protein